MTWDTSTGVVVHLSCANYGINTTGPDDCAGNFGKGEGTWNSANGHGLMGRELWAWGTGTSQADHVQTYSFPNLIGGVAYQVQAYIPDADATATRADYRIIDGTGSTDVFINQAPISNQWVTIGYGCPGVFAGAGPNPTIGVFLLNDGNGGLQIGADAIRVIESSLNC